jgi:hypothetical protein
MIALVESQLRFPLLANCMEILLEGYSAPRRPSMKLILGEYNTSKQT